MNEIQAIALAQEMANESNMTFVVLKCKLGKCKIMRIDYYEKAKNKKIYCKIFPEVR